MPVFENYVPISSFPTSPLDDCAYFDGLSLDGSTLINAKYPRDAVRDYFLSRGSVPIIVDTDTDNFWIPDARDSKALLRGSEVRLSFGAFIGYTQVNETVMGVPGKRITLSGGDTTSLGEGFLIIY